MDSRARLAAALNHKEPDRVPLDLGGTVDTGIHVEAYRKLWAFRQGVNTWDGEITLFDPLAQLARIDEGLLQELAVDVRGFIPNAPAGKTMCVRREGRYGVAVDELGMKWVKPHGGYYFDQAQDGHPLASLSSGEELESYHWPKGSEPSRLEGLIASIAAGREKRFTTLGCAFGGVFALGFRMRGYVNFYIDLVRRPTLACALMDRIAELKIEYWEMALERLGDVVDVIVLEDDLGQQDRTLISPEMYRKLVKPRHKKLIDSIKKKAPESYIFFHSDGSVYDLIPDLIELGVEILNPVQVSAAKMEPKALKKEFGKDLVFWGAGIDTQTTLSFGTPAAIRDEVRRRVDELAPGGGFVFSTIHNVQPEVPPENFMAMWEALQEYGQY